MSKELFDAIENHDIPQISALLSAGIDPNERLAEWPGWTPLQAAIDELEFGGTTESVKLLLKCGSRVDEWDAYHDYTALLMAACRGFKDAVLILLDAGADPNVVGGTGNSPLLCCVEQGNRELAQILLQHGAAATVNRPVGPCSWTLLGVAAKRLDIAFIELLLRAGADPDARDADQRKAIDRLPPAGSVDERIRALAEARLLRK